MSYSSQTSKNLDKRQAEIIRGNLIAICRLAVKSLIDQSCFYSINDECEEFINFCAVMEEILSHRLKANKAWYGEKPQHYWDYLYVACRMMPRSCVSTIAAIENIRSAEAKGRAFIRCALMEKRLSEYLSFVLKQAKLTRSFYDEGAVMLSEDGAMLCGVLLGLNAIDFSFCLKESGHGMTGPLAINFRPYLQFHQSSLSVHSDLEEMQELSSSSLSSSLTEEAALDESDCVARYKQLEKNYKATCEQKGYLEELVRLRESQLEEAQQQQHEVIMRLQHLEKESRNDRWQLETIVLELQGQLATMQSVYGALQQKLSSLTSQQRLAQYQGPLQMTDFVSDVTVGYSALTQELTNNVQFSEPFNETHLPASRLEQSTRGLQSGIANRDDTRSLLSGSPGSTVTKEDTHSVQSLFSGQFTGHEDTPSLIPLAGSLTSVDSILPAVSHQMDDNVGSGLASPSDVLFIGNDDLQQQPGATQEVFHQSCDTVLNGGQLPEDAMKKLSREKEVDLLGLIPTDTLSAPSDSSSSDDTRDSWEVVAKGDQDTNGNSSLATAGDGETEHSLDNSDSSSLVEEEELIREKGWQRTQASYYSLGVIPSDDFNDEERVMGSDGLPEAAEPPSTVSLALDDQTVDQGHQSPKDNLPAEQVVLSTPVDDQPQDCQQPSET